MRINQSRNEQTLINVKMNNLLFDNDEHKERETMEKEKKKGWVQRQWSRSEINCKVTGSTGGNLDRTEQRCYVQQGGQKPKILNQRAYEGRKNEKHAAGPAEPTSSVCRGVMKAARLHVFCAFSPAPRSP